jgi:hypothetical protein
MNAHTLVIRADEAHAVFATYHDHDGQLRMKEIVTTGPEHARRVEAVINAGPVSQNFPAVLAAVGARTELEERDGWFVP